MNQGHCPDSATRPPMAGEYAPGRPKIRMRDESRPSARPARAHVSDELRERLCSAAASTSGEDTGSSRLAAAATIVRQVAAALGVGVVLAIHRVATPEWHIPGLLIAALLLCTTAVHYFTGGIRWRTVLALFGFSRAEEDESPGRPPRRRIATLALAAGLACLAPVVYAAGTALAVLAVTALGYTVLFTRAIPAAIRSQAETVGRVGLTVTGVAAAYHVLGGGWTVNVVTAGLQLGLMASVAGAVDSIRDLAADRRAGRRTVSARLGVPIGRYLVAVLCLVPYTLGLCWLLAGDWVAAALPLLAAPLVWQVVRDVQTHIPGHMLEPAVKRAGWLHLAFAGLLAVGLVL